MTRTILPWSNWTPVLFEDLGKEMGRFVERFADDDSLVVGQRDVGIGPRFDVANQVGVENEHHAIQTREFDHGCRRPRRGPERNEF